MNPRNSLLLLSLIGLLSGCASTNNSNTLASLNLVNIEIKDEKVEDGLNKALSSYEQFLKQAPESSLTPEAMRRLADLKIKKEYESEDSAASTATNLTESNLKPAQAGSSVTLPAISTSSNTSKRELKSVAGADTMAADSPIAVLSESEKEFSERASQEIEVAADKSAVVLPEAGEVSGAQEAIALYKKLLTKYPYYERNDQVLYQLSRAYEDLGEIEIAMKTLDDLVKQYPKSRHIEEANFRRGEYEFARKKYESSENYYQSIINIGEASEFYEFALYKQGWSYFKQELHERALQNFIGVLDYKIANGYDLENSRNKIEKKHISDTFRVVSLSFSYLGGAEAIEDFFKKHGRRFYEASIYSHLAEHYHSKRRFADAAETYQVYTGLYPDSKEAVFFDMRSIEIFKDGGFPKLIIEAKKKFATSYDLESKYWMIYDVKANEKAYEFLKSNIYDLAGHYHALFQDRRFYKMREQHYQEAIVWYRKYLKSFPREPQTPGLNNQLAEMMLQNKDFLSAGQEFERTAYNYPLHEKSDSAGYAAVYTYREHLKTVSQAQRNSIKREIIRVSVRFAEQFPQHKDAPLVLVAAVNDLFEMQDYQQAINYGRRVVSQYPKAEGNLHKTAWMIVGHSSFELAQYEQAEPAYSQALKLTPSTDKDHRGLIENLAASIYKQGEQAQKLENYILAAKHFLRVADVTPTSKIRSTAQYDGATSLIMAKQWKQAIPVLESYRKSYPKDKYQKEITKKLAYVYKEDAQYLKSASEYERVAAENPKDGELVRDAYYQAADSYELMNADDKALSVYYKIVRMFPKPLEHSIEIRQKIADIQLKKNNRNSYINELKAIVSLDKNAGKERTDRTKYLAAKASLVLTEPLLEQYKKIALSKPFKVNLRKKKQSMKRAIDGYTKLLDYNVAEVTAAATYYLAEIYYEFNVSMLKSERPSNLDEFELEQYELVIEEQAFPFEDKAINVHKKNVELISVGIYNQWVEKSIGKLANLIPARYAKTEQESSILTHIKQTINSDIKSGKSKMATKEAKVANIDIQTH